MSGFPNPFGLDFTEIMRMLQSPGPVNMEIARSTAEGMATVDTESLTVEGGQPVPEASISADEERAFDEIVRAVGHMVAESTGITAALTLPARGVNRSAWVGCDPDRARTGSRRARHCTRARAPDRAMPTAPASPAAGAGFAPEAFASEAMYGMLMQQLMPLLLGLWSGSMIGLLSHRALGQFDLPFPLEGAPTLLFVVPNIDAFAQEWSLPGDELRHALALREVVHGAQRSVPWVRERLVRLASEYVGAYEVNPHAIEEQLGDTGFDPTDPSSMDAMARLSDPELLLGAMRSERQGPLLEALQRYISVLEGYTDVVVESLGSRVVGSHGRIDEALRRHRLERGDATDFVDRLLGLELDRGHYDAGVAFCNGVIERTDGNLDGLNRLWTDESMVPTRAELEAPGLWLARIELPEP